MRILPLLLAIGLMTSFMATADVVGAAAPPSPLAPDETQSLQQYKVRSGDTLWGIAHSYGISVPALLAANKLTGREVLAVGRPLLLPAAAPAAAGMKLPAAKVPSLQHVVRAGDTPWDVAVTYGVTVDALLAANRLGKNPLLSVGQVLLLPAGAQPPRPRPVPSPTPVQSTAPLTATQALSATVAVTASGSISDATAIQADVVVTSAQTALPDDQPPPDDVALEAPGAGAATAVQADAVITGTQTITDTTDAAATTSLPAAIADWPRQVFDGINAKRAAHGLSPLTWSPALAQAAQAHAEDCSQRLYCSHVSSDGARLRGRLAGVGVTPAYTSENWVFARAAQPAVDWWYNEPPGRDPHRRNILSSRYTVVGIGVAVGEQGHYYFIADFAGS